jgi:hypothetical protein
MLAPKRGADMGIIMSTELHIDFGNSLYIWSMCQVLRRRTNISALGYVSELLLAYPSVPIPNGRGCVFR